MPKREELSLRTPVVTCVTHIRLRNATADVIDRVTSAGLVLPLRVVGNSSGADEAFNDPNANCDLDAFTRFDKER